MHRGLSSEGIGAPDDGFKHEARFIHEDEMYSPRRRSLQDAGERFPNPPLYHGIISVLVMMHGPLTCPIQLPLYDLRNLSAMITNPKMCLTYLEDFRVRFLVGDG